MGEGGRQPLAVHDAVGHSLWELSADEHDQGLEGGFGVTFSECR